MTSISSVLKETPLLIYGIGVIGQKTAEILQQEGCVIHGFLDAKASPNQMIGSLPVITLETWLTAPPPHIQASVLIAILNEDFRPQIPALKSRLVASGFQNIWDMQELSTLWSEGYIEIIRAGEQVREWDQRYAYPASYFYESGEFERITHLFPLVHQFEQYRFCWHEFWLLLSASLFICGEREKAEFVLDKYMAVHGLKDIFRYVPLAQYAKSRGWVDEAIVKTLSVVEKLAGNRPFLDALLTGKTIACVGNGPAEIGKGRGQEIDSHDIVIRFNNFDTSPEFSADYGQKTSLWARNLPHDIHAPASPPEAILFIHDVTRHRIPGTSLLDRILADVTHRHIPVISIPYNFFEELRRESHLLDYEMPTTGCLTLYYIMKRIAIKSIHCYGFSFSQIQTIDPDCPHYFKSTEANRSNKLFRNVHNFHKESFFLLNLLEKSGFPHNNNTSEQTKPPLDFCESPHSPYYIGTPEFTQKSAGPRALHYLCHVLNELGYEAYITTSKTNPRLRTPLLTQDIIQKHKAADRIPVAVYPEVARGNPLQQPVIARWLLNKAGHLAGHKDFHPDELMFYWDKWVLNGETDAERLLVPTIDTSIFNHKNTTIEERKGFCYYAHKYLKFGGKISEELKQNGISLCHDIPRSSEEISTILRTSKVLYCYEPSAITEEAAACGCPTIFISTGYLRQFNVNNYFSVPVIPEDLRLIPEHLFDYFGVFTPSEFNIDFSHAQSLHMALIDKYFDMEFVDRFFESTRTESLDTIKNFIQKTQEAAKAYSEKSKEPIQMLNQGIVAFQTDDFGKAITIFSDLLNKEPENPLPPAYLAFICARQGLALEANDFIEKSAQLAPDRADLKAALGESFLKTGLPDLAVGYLNDAISVQPDLLAAYPALAQSLHLTRQSEMAVSLLQSAAGVPSSAQANIQNVLLEILAQQGDIEKFTDASLRFSRALADNLLAVRNLSRFESSGEHFLDTLGKIQEQLADIGIGNEVDDVGSERTHIKPEFISSHSSGAPLKIAFMASDFVREAHSERLLALLRYLPPEKFITQLIINDPHCEHNDYANICSLLADQNLVVFGENNSVVLEKIQAAAADVLIDLDAYGPLERLEVFLKVKISHKLLWGEAPMPPLSPDCKVLTGLRWEAHSMLPCVTLPEIGEYYNFPELPISMPESSEISRTNRPVFGCLTPAIRVGREGWQLFAEVLNLHSDSQLLINLKDLGEAARDFIRARFTCAGIAAERLRFVHAHTADEICKFWQEVDLGLAPPVDTGELALPACLWMGKPYLALASPLPWARRPAALLKMVGAGEWIAETPEMYLELSRRTRPAPDPQFRARMQAAGLNDPVVFARGFADSIIGMLRDAPAASS
jgi:predicted O-linked N-acetylglucosamine transferase (SPINDLY family)